MTTHRIALLLCLALPACTAPPTLPQQEQWIRHREPLGFEVTHPPSWSVNVAGGGRIVIREGSGSMFVLIQPFLLPSSESPQQCLSQVPIRFAGVFAGASLGRMDMRKPTEAVATISFTGAAGKGRANLLCSTNGRSGMLFAIAAPDNTFDREKRTLVRILESFHFLAPAFAAWTDPLESAFTVDILQGWKASGGMFRHTVMDARPQVEAVSPDGAIRLFAGDRTIMAHTEPNAIADFHGYREGAIAPVQPGVLDVRMARYLPGAAFAGNYVASGIAPRHSGLVIDDVRDRPDAALPMANAYRQAYSAIGQVSVDAGEVTFTVGSGGVKKRGYCYALTLRIQSASTSMWWVQALYGYIAEGAQEGRARAALARMIGSTRFDPVWVERQARASNQAARVYSRLIAETSESFYRMFRRHQASRDDRMRQWTNTMLGETELSDPSTGENWKVASGHNYYWRRASDGVIAGTTTHDRPDIDFTLLREW